MSPITTLLPAACAGTVASVASTSQGSARSAIDGTARSTIKFLMSVPSLFRLIEIGAETRARERPFQLAFGSCYNRLTADFVPFSAPEKDKPPLSQEEAHLACEVWGVLRRRVREAVGLELLAHGRLQD